MILFNREFWLGNPLTAERGALDLALVSFAQALILFMGADSVGVFDLPWIEMLSLAAGAALLAVLTHIVRKGSGAGTVVPEGNGRHRADEESGE